MSTSFQPVRLQILVFALVSASFSAIYITQPVLPVMQEEFGVGVVTVSLSVSAVLLGIALANLPFGFLADRLPILPIVLTGGVMVSVAGLLCAWTDSLSVLIGARFVQGLFIPALTTCLVAFLAKTLPVHRLNVVMGSYVAATVLGGLGGRLLGGWLHPPLHWRYAFISSSILLLVATALAFWGLPREPKSQSKDSNAPTVSYGQLLKRADLWPVLLCAAGSFALFSSIFNFLPFRLSEPAFGYTPAQVTMIYLAYVMGIVMGPLSGKFSNRFGGGVTLLVGVAVLSTSLLFLLSGDIWLIGLALVGVCAGYFSIHAAAVGLLNRKLDAGHGRANALYVLFYYVGGWIGISFSGVMYQSFGWHGVMTFGALCLLVPTWVGWREWLGAKPSAQG